MPEHATVAVGGLVRARGREWVVQPRHDLDAPEVVRVRPIGGLDEEVTAIHGDLESITPATFAPPTVDDLGDHEGGRLLRDAARLSSRSCAGPFRSLARISVEPRPYQYVPLLMAMKLDPVRLLIADDVGIGKTVEAGLIARELLDRGEIRRMAVLCPPHLAEQWRAELVDKFHIEPELVLTSTVARLERPCKVGESLFQLYPFVVVSTDFIKTPRRRDEFIRTCPEFVIVDEAHGCANAAGMGKGQQLRHDLLQRLREDEDRHIVLVTATPHSGKHEAFASLCSILDPRFAALPETATSDADKALRRDLADHFVQRQRGNIVQFLGENTLLPTRTPPNGKTIEYGLDPEYKRVFDDILDWAAGELGRDAGDARAARVRRWSVLGLLRTLGSSPAAAVATLKNRSRGDDESDEVDPDELEVLARTFDTDGDESEETPDVVPAADEGVAANAANAIRKRLRAFAAEIEQFDPKRDAKLDALEKELRSLLKEGFRPIVFCRYVDTARYVAEQLRSRLTGKKFAGLEIGEVTGRLPHSDREARIRELTSEEHPKRILVCTDCLSEGINLQHGFDAVVHYDLSWNPMRHEQREGRVDRFGQERSEVAMASLICSDNEIDLIVMDVLLRKHIAIRNDLGISVALPGKSEQIVDALAEKLLHRQGDGGAVLPGFEDLIEGDKRDLHKDWDKAHDREKANRSIYAQNAIRIEEVEEAVAAVRRSMGGHGLVESFVHTAVPRLKGIISEPRRREIEVDLAHSDRSARQAILGPSAKAIIRGWFDLPVDDGVAYLSRTHPVVEGLSSFVMESSLDDQLDGIGARAGVSIVEGIETVTNIVLTRMRFNVTMTEKDRSSLALVEEVVPLGFEGRPREESWAPDWLPEDTVMALLDRPPAGTPDREDKETRIERLIAGTPAIRAVLEPVARHRAEALKTAHVDIRKAGDRDRRAGRVKVEPILPVDILGYYVLMPKLGGGR